MNTKRNPSNSALAFSCSTHKTRRQVGEHEPAGPCGRSWRMMLSSGQRKVRKAKQEHFRFQAKLRAQEKPLRKRAKEGSSRRTNGSRPCVLVLAGPPPWKETFFARPSGRRQGQRSSPMQCLPGFFCRCSTVSVIHSHTARYCSLSFNHLSFSICSRLLVAQENGAPPQKDVAVKKKNRVQMTLVIGFS